MSFWQRGPAPRQLVYPGGQAVFAAAVGWQLGAGRLESHSGPARASGGPDHPLPGGVRRGVSKSTEHDRNIT